MAREVGISRHSVHQIWRKNELKPHRTKTFKVSNDPRFEEKFWDIIGLYLDPPEKALVFCCDEKSQWQALERTQPGLPLGIGHIQTKTHDYIRHGTTTLFAALDYIEGCGLKRTEDRHTHVEWLRFLKLTCPMDWTGSGHRSRVISNVFFSGPMSFIVSFSHAFGKHGFS